MSCLFNSLSKFINLSSIEIRNKICDYLESNHPIIENMNTKDILLIENKINYVENMRNMSTWGGAIEIQVACNLWNCKIFVHNIRNSSEPRSSAFQAYNSTNATLSTCNKNQSIIEFIPLHSKIDKIINISWNGGHYEPINV